VFLYKHLMQRQNLKLVPFLPIKRKIGNMMLAIHVRVQSPCGTEVQRT